MSMKTTNQNSSKGTLYQQQTGWRIVCHVQTGPSGGVYFREDHNHHHQNISNHEEDNSDLGWDWNVLSFFMFFSCLLLFLDYYNLYML